MNRRKFLQYILAMGVSLSWFSSSFSKEKENLLVCDVIIGSGGITHNLAAFQFADKESPSPEWVISFNGWVYKQLSSNKAEILFQYRTAHEHGQINQPSPDHILPLFVAMGAGNHTNA